MSGIDTPPVAAAQAFLDPRIGTMIPGQNGIFMGFIQPVAEGPLYPLFAAPINLDRRDNPGAPLLTNFDAMLMELGSRKNWHGHDGRMFRNQDELITGISEGTAIDRWVIPTADWVGGRSYADLKKQGVLKTPNPDQPARHRTLYELKDTPTFIETLISKEMCGFHYLLMTCNQSYLGDNILAVNFDQKKPHPDSFWLKNRFEMSCRPFRVGRPGSVPVLMQ